MFKARTQHGRKGKLKSFKWNPYFIWWLSCRKFWKLPGSPTPHEKTCCNVFTLISCIWLISCEFMSSDIPTWSCKKSKQVHIPTLSLQTGSMAFASDRTVRAMSALEKERSLFCVAWFSISILMGKEFWRKKPRDFKNHDNQVWNWDAKAAQNNHFNKFTSVLNRCEEIESANFVYLRFFSSEI